MTDSTPPKHRKPLVAYTDDGLYLSGRVLAVAIVTVLGGGGVGAFSVFGVTSDEVQAHDTDPRAHLVADADKGVVRVVEQHERALAKIDENAQRMERKIDRVGVIVVNFVAETTVKEALAKAKRRDPESVNRLANRVRAKVRENLASETPKQAAEGLEPLLE